MSTIKALHILGMADIGDAQAEIFKKIYQVVRLHIPDVLYKYYANRFLFGDKMSSSVLKMISDNKGKIMDTLHTKAMNK